MLIKKARHVKPLLVATSVPVYVRDIDAALEETPENFVFPVDPLETTEHVSKKKRNTRRGSGTVKVVHDSLNRGITAATHRCVFESLFRGNIHSSIVKTVDITRSMEYRNAK